MVLIRRKFCLAIALVLASLSGTFAASCPAPRPLTFTLESEIKRDVLGFTQGLEFRDGILFESTGSIAGATRLHTIDANGKVTELANYGQSIFGEGLTILNDTVFQISWQDRVVIAYDLAGKVLRKMRNPRDGWGLTNDGKSLIFTDGGNRLYYADPASFAIQRSVPVRLGASTLNAINELEYVDGKIYGNVFTTWSIVRIDPATGCVEATADLQPLWQRMSLQERERLSSDSNFVLNGIAYDKAKDVFYLTGKNWRTIFVGRFSEAKP